MPPGLVVHMVWEDDGEYGYHLPRAFFTGYGDAVTFKDQFNLDGIDLVEVDKFVGLPASTKAYLVYRPSIHKQPYAMDSCFHDGVEWYEVNQNTGGFEWFGLATSQQEAIEKFLEREKEHLAKQPGPDSVPPGGTTVDAGAGDVKA